MKWMIIFFLFFSLSSWGNSQDSLNPFETDYCTSYSEGTLGHPNQWKHCCVEHDLYFWAGGSSQDRKKTDLRLKSCVESTGAKFHAYLMFYGVKIGGMSPVRFKSKQWGNAWGQGRSRYEKLNEQETFLVLHHLDLENSSLPLPLKNSFKQQLLGRLESK
jgi:hypothetical protein